MTQKWALVFPRRRSRPFQSDVIDFEKWNGLAGTNQGQWESFDEPSEGVESTALSIRSQVTNTEISVFINTLKTFWKYPQQLSVFLDTLKTLSHALVSPELLQQLPQVVHSSRWEWCVVYF